MGLTGAQIITEHLVREGVPYAVGLCGHGDLGLLDGLAERQDDITTISVHHESVAGFVADAYYRVAHQPLATFTSCGPGSANLPVALGSALMDDSAFLAITGNVPTSQFNRGPFQETGRHAQADFPAVVRPYVKRGYQATRAEQLPSMLRQAFALMRGGRPGPVHLDVPLDVFVERTDEPVADPSGWHTTSAPAAGRAELDAACALVRDCARVVIVAGSGVEGSGGEAELLAFATEHQLPVATSPLGKSGFPAGHPLSLGATGRNGTYQANYACRNADLVLALGTRFDDRATSSWLPGYTYSFPPTRLVHVHIDPVELGRNFPPTVGINASPREVLRQLHERLADFTPADSEARQRWLDRLGRPARSGRGTSSRTTGPTRRRSIRSACSPNCARRCRPTASCCPTWACTTTGSCSTGEPSCLGPCCRAGVSRRWASVSAGCSARSSPRRTGRPSRSWATAGS